MPQLPSLIRGLRIAVLLSALTGPLLKAASYDLTRTTPVAANEPIPAGDFLRPNLLQQPTISPDGSHIAAVVTMGEDRHVLLVYDVKSRTYGLVGGTGDYDIGTVIWLNSKRLIYEISAQKLYGIGLYAAEVNDLNDTYPLLQYFGARIVSIPKADRLSPLVWLSWDGLTPGGGDLGAATINSAELSRGKGFNLLTASPEALWANIQPIRDNNDLHILQKFPAPKRRTTGYIADKEGNMDFAVTDEHGHSELLRLDGDSWKKCPVDMDHGWVVGPGRTPAEILARPPHKDGVPSPLRYRDAATGTWGDVVCDDPGYDFIGGVYRDRVTGEVLGVLADREGPHNIWLNDKYRHYQDVLNRSFPGLYVRILQSDDAQTIFLVATYSDTQPVRYSWVDFAHHSAGLFKDARPWIDPKRMQPQNIVRFKTRDGKVLDAYLTLPAGASKARPAPMVVLPHGGPWVRDDWGFDGEAQFLASRGYAVLKPNYRGSSGTEWKFQEKDDWDFVKMSHDVTDATKAILATGLVDPDRVAIMGGSFGGYLSLEGVVDQPSLYRCAVCISGVFDWAQLISDKKYDYTQFGDPGYARLIKNLGDPRTETAKFDEIAPVRHVDRVKVPVFVTHGKDDPVADVGQSYRLISELEKHGVPHETYIVGSEGHGMYYFSNRLEQYERIEAFLDRNMAAR
ncbi:MAG TPA: alpha/beta fold hydrolase [Opitutaceae bacterium]|jgi:acetyl esterase/lipase